MIKLTLRRVDDYIYRVITDQGEHVGNLKLINAVWKFKAIGFDKLGNFIPGGGPLTLKHNMIFTSLDETKLSASLSIDDLSIETRSAKPLV